ncbi:MAG TPA: hypothetical protein VGG46_04085 [Terriglobales bacterium]|jgi:hypothetical protein
MGALPGLTSLANAPNGLQIAQAPQNALAEYARVAQLKAQTAEEQQQTAGLQQAQQLQQRQMNDQDAFTKTISQFDPAKNTIADIPKMVTANGGSGEAAIKAQQGLVTQKQNLLKLSDDQFAQQQKQADLIQGVHDEVSQAPADRKNATYQAGLQRLAGSGVDVSKEPPDYPGDDVFAQHLAPIQLHSAIVNDAAKQRDADQNAAKARQENAVAAHQEIINKLSQNSKPGDFDSQIDSLLPPKNPQTAGPNNFTKVQVNAALNRGDVPGAQKFIDQAYQSQLELNKGIALATNPQVQQGKIAVAAAEGAARQNAINNPPVPGNPNLSGDAYIQTLPPALRDTVQAIGTGHMALNRLDYLLSRNPTILDAVTRAYPDFDSSKAQSYVNTYKDFTSGPTSKALNSGGTGLGHLKELLDLNTVASHIPNTPAWTAYQNKAATVSAELAKFYGDPTIPAIDAIKDTLTSTLPGNREAAIRTQAQSMGDKLDAYEQQWQNAAPSKEYQAPLPGISAKARQSRAELDPAYAARVNQQNGGAAAAHQVGDVITQNGHRYRATKVQNGKVLAADPL